MCTYFPVENAILKIQKNELIYNLKTFFRAN